MRRPEQDPNQALPEEELHPLHSYLAYIFDKAEEREEDITRVIIQAQKLGYPVRYWWLSDAIPLEGFPDRLIVCAHYPSSDEDAGMDMYQALKQQAVTWDALEAASLLEYRQLGNPVSRATEILRPDITHLFGEPIPPTVIHTKAYDQGAVMLSITDIRLDNFTPETKEQMHLSIEQTLQLYLLLLGNLDTFEEKGQPPEKTFRLLTNLMQELGKVYDLITDPKWPPDDEPELPF